MNISIKSLLKIFSEIKRKGKKLTVAGRIFSYEDIEILEKNKVDFFCLGRAAILDHQFPKRLKKMGYPKVWVDQVFRYFH